MARQKNRKVWRDDPVCAWTVDDVDGSWDTDCGNKFQFEADGPVENGMVYCCYCGRILRVVGEPPPVDAVEDVARGR